VSVQVISFNCILKNKVGRIISTTFNRDVLNSAEIKTNQLSGLSKGLQDLKKGEHRKIALAAEEAYGLYDPAKVILFPRRKLPKHTHIGQIISIAGKSGRVRVYTLIEYHNDMVSLDGNHPLAGQDLVFEIEVLDAREATNDEVEESLNVFSKQLLN
jgi:FKBP-type peptidyl-prolyl cis-trans isomerase SlyD